MQQDMFNKKPDRPKNDWEWVGARRESAPDDVSETATRGVLLVGEDNPQSSAPQYALWNAPDGCAGHRLQEKILRLPEAWYLAIWRTNLCTPTWDKDDAVVRTFELSGSDVPWSTIVMLGRKVADAHELLLGKALKPFETRNHLRAQIGRTFRYVSLPHPSGRCRDWNELGTYERTLTVMRDLLPEIPFGGIQ